MLLKVHAVRKALELSDVGMVNRTAAQFRVERFGQFDTPFYFFQGRFV